MISECEKGYRRWISPNTTKRCKIRYPVKCGACGWRGKRVIGECACYDEYALYCACTWGVCPKCGNRVFRVLPKEVNT